MIGVILWSSPDQKRAVIWCENNGGLAYLESAKDFSDEGWPDCGEIVHLTEERTAGFHYARGVRRWSDHPPMPVASPAIQSIPIAGPLGPSNCDHPPARVACN